MFKTFKIMEEEMRSRKRSRSPERNRDIYRPKYRSRSPKRNKHERSRKRSLERSPERSRKRSRGNSINVIQKEFVKIFLKNKEREMKQILDCDNFWDVFFSNFRISEKIISFEDVKKMKKLYDENPEISRSVLLGALLYSIANQKMCWYGKNCWYAHKYCPFVH